MSHRRNFFKLGLIGLALLTMVGVAAAQAASTQAISTADRALLVEAKRFEGSYKLPNGETTLKLTDATADLKLDVGGTTIKAALAPKAGKPERATLDLDGRTVEGKADVDGRTLTLTFEDGKTKYKITFTLTARNEGEIKVEKDGKSVVAGTFKRA